MKRYLVTGATGFLGRSLVRALVERGDFVRSLDNDSRGHADWLSDLAMQMEFCNGDVRDPHVVWRASKGMDAIVHLAYINGTDAFYTKPEVILDVAVRGILNVLESAMLHKIPEVSIASSSEVYQSAPSVPTDEAVPLSIPDPLNPRYSYGGGKIISELLALNFARKHTKRLTVFRPHNVYGPQMGDAHVIPQLIERVQWNNACDLLAPDANSRKLQLMIQGTGEETRAFVYISDFTAGLLRVLDAGEHRGIYNIGNPEEVTIAELARKIGRLYGREIEVIPGKLQDGSTLRRCPDISKLKALGYWPKVSLDEGLEKVICTAQAMAASV